MSRILLDPSLKLHLDGQVSKVVKYFSLVPPKLLVGHDDSDVEYGGEGDDDKGLQSSSSAKRLQYSADTLCFALCRETKMFATIRSDIGLVEVIVQWQTFSYSLVDDDDDDVNNGAE